ncbi:zinc finger C2HC domain-containing protein 1C [Pimephales promelas]|uniref:zinc finger C2HC domain-containing protein 1C n=1 Tax=Pimephales promelas TaxID=90988 RepID=UPI0019555E42|nr:zinc finger C2HC domain-containing protein 1C [Pimephales promelas]XP_039506880.1 zinc finger C2HC domain-containing protein 1C [Pimephales promelas]
MQTLPQHHLTQHFWERETVSSNLPILHRESMSRQRRPSGTHHRLDFIHNQERELPWQHPDNIHRAKNTEKNEYVPSQIALGKIFPLKPVLHKRAFSLSNVTKSPHQEILYSRLPTLADQAAVRQQQKTARKLDPISSSHRTGRKKQDQEEKQTRFPKEIQMLQQKISKAEETVRRVQKEKNGCYLEDDRFYGEGYGEWDEERDRYGNGRDYMERWEEWERRRESVKREERGRPLALDMAKGHKPEEKREWDDHTGKGNRRRERGMGWDDHLDREDEDVRKPNTRDSTRRDRAHLKHERRENKEGFEELKRLQRVELTPEENPDAPQRLLPCDVCGRRFARDRLETHVRVCERKRPERKVFDTFQHRAKGTELERFMKTNGRSKTPEPRKNTWREKHQAFIQTMRQGRDPEPQPGCDLHPEYVSCPHCGRRFAPGPAERHVPMCQNIRSRPAPPKATQGSARRTTAR